MEWGISNGMRHRICVCTAYTCHCIWMRHMSETWKDRHIIVALNTPAMLVNSCIDFIRAYCLKLNSCYVANTIFAKFDKQMVKSTLCFCVCVFNLHFTGMETTWPFAIFFYNFNIKFILYIWAWNWIVANSFITTNWSIK